jgi:hypothetical protein
MKLGWNGENVTERTSDCRISSFTSCDILVVEDTRAYLRVEDELWTIDEMHVPYGNDTIRIIQGCGVFVVRRRSQFGILGKHCLAIN